MDTDALVVLLSAILGGTGIVGAIAAYRKVKPEKDSIIVTAAQGALIVQSGVLDELREELERARTRIDALEDELHSETKRLRDERDAVREENRQLRVRVRQLEARVDELETPSSEDLRKETP